MAIHDGWCGYVTSRITPTEDYSISMRPKSSGPTYHGVLGYVEEGGPVASMFEYFCTRNLCAESWDFIVAACEYEVNTLHSSALHTDWQEARYRKLEVLA